MLGMWIGEVGGGDEGEYFENNGDAAILFSDDC
jgi:hypothetical protein